MFRACPCMGTAHLPPKIGRVKAPGRKKIYFIYILVHIYVHIGIIRVITVYLRDLCSQCMSSFSSSLVFLSAVRFLGRLLHLWSLCPCARVCVGSRSFRPPRRMLPQGTFAVCLLLDGALFGGVFPALSRGGCSQLRFRWSCRLVS